MTKFDILDEAANLREKRVDEIVNKQPVSKNYYELKYSTAKDIGKTFPQVDNIYFNPEINRIYNFSMLPKESEFKGRVELKKSAKLTDLLSSWQNGNGIMISSKCFEILKEYNLGQHTSFRFKCFLKEIESDYIYLSLNNELIDLIDFSNSVFYTSNLFNEFLKDITFLSKSEMENYMKEIDKDKYEKAGYKEGLVESNLNIKKMIIKPEFHNLDILTSGTNYYLSKRLKEILENNKFTGMEIKETRKIFYP